MQDIPTGWHWRCSAAQAPINTTAPESTTPTAVGSGNQVSNLTLPTQVQGKYRELAANNNGDFTPASDSGANDDNSDYVESRKNSPVSSDNIPELETYIKEIL